MRYTCAPRVLQLAQLVVLRCACGVLRRLPASLGAGLLLRAVTACARLWAGHGAAGGRLRTMLRGRGLPWVVVMVVCSVCGRTGTLARFMHERGRRAPVIPSFCNFIILKLV